MTKAQSWNSCACGTCYILPTNSNQRHVPDKNTSHLWLCQWYLSEASGAHSATACWSQWNGNRSNTITTSFLAIQLVPVMWKTLSRHTCLIKHIQMWLGTRWQNTPAAGMERNKSELSNKTELDMGFNASHRRAKKRWMVLKDDLLGYQSYNIHSYWLR